MIKDDAHKDYEEYDDGYGDDGYEDGDYGSGEDSEDELDEPTVPCPYCRREIHEDAQRCPHCEQYISAEDAPPRRKPWWILIGVALCLYVVYDWMF